MATPAQTAAYAEIPNERRLGDTNYQQRRDGDPSTRTWPDPVTGEPVPTAGPGGPNGRPIRPMRADRDGTTAGGS